jgi:hypothetical protein
VALGEKEQPFRVIVAEFCYFESFTGLFLLKLKSLAIENYEL